MKLIGKGYWRDVYETSTEGVHIVFKHMKDKHERSQRNFDRHKDEALALAATANSPYIIPLLGYCNYDIITPYMPEALEDLVFGHESSDNGETVPPLDMGSVLKLALEAARGVAVIHTVPGGPVVHADLQPRQFLFDETGTLRLNDLNRCKIMDQNKATGKPCPFTYEVANGVWRAPEEYALKPLDEKVDIYSLGLVFYSLLTKKRPYVLDDEEKYKEYVLSGGRPYLDPSWHQSYSKLMADMWAHRSSQRPSSTEVVKRLETMAAEYSEELSAVDNKVAHVAEVAAAVQP